MSRRSWVPVLAGVVALALAGWVLLRRPPSTPDVPVEVVDRPETPRPAEETPTRPPEPVRGGVYEGKVVDAADRPVAEADVLLVADAGVRTVILEPTGAAAGVVEPLAVPSVGGHVTAARVKTDAGGRFRASAGEHAVQAVMAVHPAHAPGILTAPEGGPLPPGGGLVVRLPAAGRLQGLVLDAESREPVRNAQVTIFVQNVANQEAPGPRPFSATNAFAKFHEYVHRELAEAAWGIKPLAGEAGLNVWTDGGGRFQFGPVSDQVQLEVMITHPEYKWEEFDPEAPFPREVGPQGGSADMVGRRRRTVVTPGETVERTYALHRGAELTGRVVDERDRAVGGVNVHVRHVVQQFQHRLYRDKARSARADEKGRFRVAGLDRGPYEVTFEHPSFGREVVAGVKADAPGEAERTFRVAAAGWIDAAVEWSGAEAEPASYGVLVHLEPADPASRLRAKAPARLVVRDGGFRMGNVAPGEWNLWLEQGDRVTQPQKVVVAPAQGAAVQLAFAAGSSVRASLRDAEDRPVDPATLSLRPVEGSAGGGDILARAGEVSGNVTLPGTYEAVARAVGYLDEPVGKFTLAPGATTDLGTVRMRKSGFLKIVSVTDEAGRAPTEDVRMTVAEGEQPPALRLSVGSGLLPVRPGPVTLRATSGGRSFEQALEVGEGQTVDVRIVLAPR